MVIKLLLTTHFTSCTFALYFTIEKEENINANKDQTLYMLYYNLISLMSFNLSN